MKRIIKIPLIIIAFLTIASLVVPFFVFSNEKEALEMVGNLTGATAGLAAVIIAFLFYEKFGVSRKMIERQSETVFEFLEALKSTRILGESESGFMQIFIQEDLSSYKLGFLENIQEKKIIVRPNNYANGIKGISRFAESIWIPNEIKEKIHPLMLWRGTPVKDQSKLEIDFVKVYFPDSNYDPKSEGNWYNMNMGEMNFGEYLKGIEELIVVTKKWIDRHSDFDVPLNI